MKMFANFSRKIVLLATLGLANFFVWGCKLVAETPVGSLYSSGTAFSTDGTVLTFYDKVTFKEDTFSFSTKYRWNDKSNTLQEFGSTSRGLWGDYLLAVHDSTTYGSSLLTELDLDEDFLFSRGYMQSAQAKLSLIPLFGEYAGICYYMIYERRVYCGTNTSRIVAEHLSPDTTLP